MENQRQETPARDGSSPARGCSRASVESERPLNLPDLIRQAEAGDPKAMYTIGLCLNEGLGGLEKDPQAAVQWFFKSAQLANEDAQFALGWAYLTGEGVPQMDEPARKWFELAAQHGHAPSQNQLALCYAAGKGVNKDFLLALYWWKQAAESGFPEAQFNLALYYAKGEAVDPDWDEARIWWTKAAQQGFAPAVECLLAMENVERET